MFTQEQASTVIGGTLFGANNEKIGKIGQIFVDDETGRPEWVTVHTGLFGTNESFVPVSDGSLQGNDLSVPFGKDQIKDAPNVDPSGGHLSEAEEEQLYAYYGLTRSEARGYDSTAGFDRSAGYDATTTRDSSASFSEGQLDADGRSSTGRDAVGYDTSGPTTDDAMTRSEEHLRAGTETVEAGRARLRKWVETENQTITVPVTKEKARLVTEPITDANRGEATSGPDISEEEHEVVLHEERAVVTTETVPVERVRLETEAETVNETVSGEVRKEHIDLDDNSEVVNRDVR